LSSTAKASIRVGTAGLKLAGVERALEAIRCEMRDLQALGWSVISEFGTPDAR
jgi:hypothetical protein